MGRGREQQERISVIPKSFGELIILRLLRLCPVVSRTQSVSLIENDQVPLSILKQRTLVFLPLESVKRGNRCRLQVPHTRVHRSEIPPEDFEIGLKFFLKLLLPLPG